ncbi:MAG TPA: hypothetical protein VGN34_25360, partial [Ktedonobacteraceae bacterium]
SYKAYVEQLQALPFLGPYWNEYAEIYIKNDIRPEGDGSVVAKADVQAIIEESKRFHEGRPEEQWANVHVPTLLLRAGQQLMQENDQVLSESAAERIQQNIADCQLVSYPTLNHYTILFGIEPGPMQELQKFIG